MVAALSNGLFISEFLGDNAGGNAFDTDGDGGANKADEFIEIQSRGKDPASLDGIEIWSGQRGLLFQFPSGNTIFRGETATVVGQYDGAEPPGFFDAGLPDNNFNQGFLEDGEGSRFDTLYLIDTNTGEYVELSYGDPPQVQPLPSGFPGTNLVGSETINSNLPNGVNIARDSDGNLVEDGSPDPGQRGPVCFARGTLIRTPDGEQPIEDIHAGDLVWTLDHGAQPVRWAGMYRATAAMMARSAAFRPILIKAGALGWGRPQRDLIVSPQHRLLVASPISARMFDGKGVLVAAKKLVGAPGIAPLPSCESVDYFHLLLPRHEILMANGAPAESLLLGQVAWQSVGAEAAAAIGRLFPETRSPSYSAEAARQIASGRRMRRMLDRHRKNDRQLLEDFAG